MAKKSQKAINDAAAALINKVAEVNERHAALLTCLYRDKMPALRAAIECGVRGHRAEIEIAGAHRTLVDVLTDGQLAEWQPDAKKTAADDEGAGDDEAAE